MFPILQIGPLALQTPGLFIILGIWVGLTISERHSHRYNISPETLSNMVFTFLVTGILGARIVYAVRYFDAFSETPLDFLSLNPGLFDLNGGIGIGFITTLIYGNRRHVPFWEFLDALTLLLAVTATSYYLSQLASGDAFGLETSLPWGIPLWGARRHPTQIYNFLAAIGVLVIIWLKAKFAGKSNIPGNAFLAFIAFSAGARLLLDAFRGDSVIIFYQIRITQVLAWCLLATSVLLEQRRKKT